MDELTQEAREALLADYALRRLDPARDASVAAWLANHPELRETLADYARISTGLLHTPAPRPAPAAMKAKLMAQARAHAGHVRPRPLPERRPSLLDWLRGGIQTPRLAFGLTALIAVGALAWTMGQVRTLGIQNTALAARLEQQATDNAALTARLQQQDGALAAANSPTAQNVKLGGTETAPQAVASLRFEPDQHQGVLSVANLPRLPAGKQYQFWFFGPDGKPLPGVAFDGAPGTPVVINADQAMRDYVQFAVTIEPSGGLPQPSGPIALVGKA